MRVSPAKATINSDSRKTDGRMVTVKRSSASPLFHDDHVARAEYVGEGACTEVKKSTGQPAVKSLLRIREGISAASAHLLYIG
jgi:hypothetical protein